MTHPHLYPSLQGTDRSPKEWGPKRGVRGENLYLSVCLSVRLSQENSTDLFRLVFSCILFWHDDSLSVSASCGILHFDHFTFSPEQWTKRTSFPLIENQEYSRKFRQLNRLSLPFVLEDLPQGCDVVVSRVVIFLAGLVGCFLQGWNHCILVGATSLVCCLVPLPILYICCVPRCWSIHFLHRLVLSNPVSKVGFVVDLIRHLIPSFPTPVSLLYPNPQRFLTIYLLLFIVPFVVHMNSELATLLRSQDEKWKREDACRKGPPKRKEKNTWNPKSSKEARASKQVSKCGVLYHCTTPLTSPLESFHWMLKQFQMEKWEVVKEKVEEVRLQNMISFPRPLSLPSPRNQQPNYLKVDSPI